MQVKGKLLIFRLILLGLVLLIAVGTFYEVKYKDAVKDNISTLDSISYLSIDGSRHIIKSSSNFKVIFFFNPECDHCQREAKLISENAPKLTDADIYFFSMEDLPSIHKFADEFDLNNHPNFKIGRVDYERVFHKMGVNTYPMSFIYSPNGKLIKQYVGEVKVEGIVKYLR